MRIHRVWNLARGAVKVVLISACASSRLVSQADESRAWRDTAGVIPVAFSFSGAISMGSYQAGVNWALMNFVGLTRSDSIYRQSRKLPEFQITSLSGASAGNINALFAAIEYCDTTSIRKRFAEQSLFWKMWVLTGWDQIMPSGGDSIPQDDPGIFSRKAVRSFVERGTISGALVNRPYADCRIPIGLLVTKVKPDIQPLSPDLTISNQRFVVPFEARVVDGQLRFLQASPKAQRDSALGSRIFVGDTANGPIPDTTIYDVVEASSSYPAAFAPRILSYYPDKCAYEGRTVEECRSPKKDAFMDGGVFDNLPLSTALQLFRSYRSERRKADGRPFRDSSKVRLLFVDPGILRDPILSAERRSKPQQDTASLEGMNALFSFSTGFIPSARKYELQLFARGSSPDLEQFVGTKRALPAISDHLNAFAGFFGRPFREFDFYAGVADGVHFIAEDILCNEVRRGFIVAAQTPMAARDRCIRQEMQDLVQSRFALSEVAAQTINDLLRVADSGVSIWRRTDPKFLDSTTLQRLTVMRAITTANTALLQADSARCRFRGFIAAPLCSGSFLRFIDSLESQPVGVSTIFQRWAAQPVCRLPIDDPRRAECLAERDLWRLLRAPDLQLYSYMGDGLRRLRTVEEKRAVMYGSTGFLKTARVLEFAYRSMDLRYRRGWNLDPSSIPTYVSGRTKLLHAIPYYVGWRIGNRGTEVGWLPTYHLGPVDYSPIEKRPFTNLAIVVPSAISYAQHISPSKRAYLETSVTPSFAKKTGASRVTQYEIGARIASLVGSDKPLWTLDPQMSVTFYSKFRVSAYGAATSITDNNRTFAVSFDLADVNGLLYWFAR